jgi:hypothetical protein
MNNETNREFPDLIKAGLKVGDKVYSYLYGEGVVYQIYDFAKLSIEVIFDGFSKRFDEFGFESLSYLMPSIHLQPWNPIVGEPFPFPKWEPIVGNMYGFWGNIHLKHSLVYGEFDCKMADKFVIIGSNYHFDNCAPISEALRIFGFDKVGEGAK